MRSLLLKMWAFGPYAGEQVVDFRSALNAGLFGIYGPTDRESPRYSARSHSRCSASPRETTRMHPLSGPITRVPTALRRWSSSSNSARANIWCVAGLNRCAPPSAAARRQRSFIAPGFSMSPASPWMKSLPKTRARLSRRRKSPRFVKSWSAGSATGRSSSARSFSCLRAASRNFWRRTPTTVLKSLRDLFDVSLYKRLTQKMKDDARAIEEKIRADRQACNSRLAQEGFETLEQLSAGAEQAREEQKIALALADAAKDKAALAEQTLAAANEAEKTFAENEEAARALALFRPEARRSTRTRLFSKGRKWRADCSMSTASCSARAPM